MTKNTQLMGSKVCFSCNNEGHWARECPRNAPGERKPGSQNFGRRFQGARNWGPPMARARDNQAPEQMKREEMGPSTGAIPKRR
ncbi:hypothetical protein JTB14_034071 [Gonioctena quinquepunctata]|nr:hypothetical protein JTB14_034071 [Gonioctena quinquepunctata]